MEKLRHFIEQQALRDFKGRFLMVLVVLFQKYHGNCKTPAVGQVFFEGLI